MRYDLAFVLCCCKSFLGTPNESDESTDGHDHPDSNNSDSEDYYRILGIPKDATMDDIKRAYKKQSLLFHPDKLLQRNISMTAELQKKFTNIKEAYDVLSNPNQRDIYNVFGKRGIKFMEEPLGSGNTFLDPNVLLHNFAKSSVWDRSKIFLIFVLVLFVLLIQPILICLHVDHIMKQQPEEPKRKLWALTFIPLWIWNALSLLYHIHIIAMGPISRPDHIPAHEVWVDPLPMSKRIHSLLRFLLVVLLEIFLVLKWDEVIPHLPYYIIFIPYFVLEIMGLYKKYPLSNMRIVTVHDLEVALGKPFSEFTMAEKQLIAQRYSVVANLHCPEYYLAYQLKFRSKQEVQHAILRILFVILLIVQFDVWQPQHDNDDADAETSDTLNYFLIFLPIFLMSILICCTNYYNYIEIRKSVNEKDPTLFATTMMPPVPDHEHPTTAYGTMDENPTTTTTPNDASQKNPYHSTLTEAEREVLQQQLSQSRQKMYQKCSVQCFLMILLILFVCKCNGATFTSFYILLPFLLLAGMILCCIGCAIFGVTEVPTDGIHFQDVVAEPTAANNNNNNNPTNTTTGTDDHYMNAAEMGTAKPNQNNVPPTTNNNIPIIIPPPPAADVASDTAGNNAVSDSLDHTTTNHQSPDERVDTTNDSDMNVTTTIDPTCPVPVLVEGTVVIGENGAAVPSQSETRPVLSPTSLTADNHSNTPQINELD